MPEFIRTRDENAISSAFNALPKPSDKLVAAATGLIEAVSEFEVEMHGVSATVRATGLGRWVRKIGEKKRLYAAAWNWLRPVSPTLRLAPGKLRALQRRMELDHLSLADFLQKLADQCIELATAHPPLSRFIEARKADVDFASSQAPTTPHEAKPDVYHRALLTAMGNQDANLAVKLVSDLLSVTASVLRSVLDDEPQTNCVFDANLMIPVPLSGTPADTPDLGSLNESGPYQEAERIWKNTTAHAHCWFAVVAGSHAGFWMPDLRFAGAALPGAPEAFRTGCAQAVFVDDLPHFPISDESARSRWKEYLRSGRPDTFAGQMFLSVPIVMTGVSAPVGVVNVNVDRRWIRGYSRHWRERAQEVAAPWLTQIWLAYEVAVLSRVNRLGVGRVLDSPTPTKLLLEGVGRRLLSGGGGSDAK